MPNLTTLLLTDAVDKAWSEEAREAAAEARQAGSKGGAKEKPKWREGVQRGLRPSGQQRTPTGLARMAMLRRHTY